MRPCHCNKFSPDGYRPGDCRLCWLYHNDKRYRELWDKRGVQPVPIMTKAFRYSKAYIRWAAAGFPSRKTVDQEKILETCKSCPMFDSVKVVCTKCGCNLKSKIRMATETCPEGKW